MINSFGFDFFPNTPSKRSIYDYYYDESTLVIECRGSQGYHLPQWQDDSGAIPTTDFDDNTNNLLDLQVTVLSDYAARLQFFSLSSELTSQYRCISQLSDQFLQFFYTPGK